MTHYQSARKIFWELEVGMQFAVELHDDKIRNAFYQVVRRNKKEGRIFKTFKRNERRHVCRLM